MIQQDRKRRLRYRNTVLSIFFQRQLRVCNFPL